MERSWRANTRPSAGLPKAGAVSVPFASCSWNSGLFNRQINIRSIFAKNERGTEWQPLMGIGNPVADRAVKQYLANVREEQ